MREETDIDLKEHILKEQKKEVNSDGMLKTDNMSTMDLSTIKISSMVKVISHLSRSSSGTSRQVRGSLRQRIKRWRVRYLHI